MKYQSIQKDYPDLKPYDDGRFACLAMTLDDGRYLVVTDLGGMDYPTHSDFMVCVYRSEESFGDDPSQSVLGCATSDAYEDIECALHDLHWLTMGDLS